MSNNDPTNQTDDNEPKRKRRLRQDEIRRRELMSIQIQEREISLYEDYGKKLTEETSTNLL